jgi:hypothetical protein
MVAPRRETPGAAPQAGAGPVGRQEQELARRLGECGLWDVCKSDVHSLRITPTTLPTSSTLSSTIGSYSSFSGTRRTLPPSA